MLFKALARPLVNNVVKIQTRNTSAVVGAPTSKVSAAERAVLGSIMVSSWLVIPAWVLLHLKEYKAPKAE